MINWHIYYISHNSLSYTGEYEKYSNINKKDARNQWGELEKVLDHVIKQEIMKIRIIFLDIATTFIFHKFYDERLMFENGLIRINFYCNFNSHQVLDHS